MTSQRSDWGDEVLPGVYMLRRSTNVELTQRIVNADGKINLELIHLEMEELARDIERLRKSNDEIIYYLSHKEEYKTDFDEEEDCSMAAMLATTTGGAEEEGDDEIFREALQENEGVITRKEAELAIMQALVADQKCGCHAHAASEVAPLMERSARAGLEAQTTSQPEAAPHNRITL